MARTTRSSGSPKLSRRCAVIRTRSSSATSPSRPAMASSASTTVLPVRKIFSAGTSSDASARAARCVGTKLAAETRSTTRRFISSGKGWSKSPVRRPASTWPTRTRRWNAAIDAHIAVVVSPWTRSQSGFSRSSTASMPANTRDDSSFIVWSGRIRSRSTSGASAKSASTWSSICRCCAVAQRMVRHPGSSRRRRMTGAILMASGRVPTTTMSFMRFRSAHRARAASRRGPPRDRPLCILRASPGAAGAENGRSGPRPRGGTLCLLAAMIPEVFECPRCERQFVIDSVPDTGSEEVHCPQCSRYPRRARHRVRAAHRARRDDRAAVLREGPAREGRGGLQPHRLRPRDALLRPRGLARDPRAARRAEGPAHLRDGYKVKPAED